MSRPIALIVGMSLIVAVPASSQTQITTGVIQGTVSDPTGGARPGRRVEVRNVETNSPRAQTTGRRWPLRVPPASARAATS